jgi:hypothetical protein
MAYKLSRINVGAIPSAGWWCIDQRARINIFRHSWLVGSWRIPKSFRPGAITHPAIQEHPKMYYFEHNRTATAAANDRLECGDVRAEEPAGFGLNGVGWRFLGV